MASAWAAPSALWEPADYIIKVKHSRPSAPEEEASSLPEGLSLKLKVRLENSEDHKEKEKSDHQEGKNGRDQKEDSKQDSKGLFKTVKTFLPLTGGPLHQEQPFHLQAILNEANQLVGWRWHLFPFMAPIFVGRDGSLVVDNMQAATKIVRFSSSAGVVLDNIDLKEIQVDADRVEFGTQVQAGTVRLYLSEPHGLARIDEAGSLTTSALHLDKGTLLNQGKLTTHGDQTLYLYGHTFMNTGLMQAKGQSYIQQGGYVHNMGHLHSHQTSIIANHFRNDGSVQGESIRIVSYKGFENEGMVESLKQSDIVALGLLRNHGTLQSNQRQNLYVFEGPIFNYGTLSAPNNTVAAWCALLNMGHIDGKETTIQVKELQATTTSVLQGTSVLTLKVKNALLEGQVNTSHLHCSALGIVRSALDFHTNQMTIEVGQGATFVNDGHITADHFHTTGRGHVRNRQQLTVKENAILENRLFDQEGILKALKQLTAHVTSRLTIGAKGCLHALKAVFSGKFTVEIAASSESDQGLQVKENLDFKDFSGTLVNFGKINAAGQVQGDIQELLNTGIISFQDACKLAIQQGINKGSLHLLNGKLRFSGTFKNQGEITSNRHNRNSELAIRGQFINEGCLQNVSLVGSGHFQNLGVLQNPSTIQVARFHNARTAEQCGRVIVEKEGSYSLYFSSLIDEWINDGLIQSLHPYHLITLAASKVTNTDTGRIESQGDLQLKSTQLHNKGTIKINQDISLQDTKLTNDGFIEGKNITFTVTPPSSSHDRKHSTQPRKSSQAPSAPVSGGAQQPTQPAQQQPAPPSPSPAASSQAPSAPTPGGAQQPTQTVQPARPRSSFINPAYRALEKKTVTPSSPSAVSVQAPGSQQANLSGTQYQREVISPYNTGHTNTGNPANTANTGNPPSTPQTTKVVTELSLQSLENNRTSDTFSSIHKLPSLYNTGTLQATKAITGTSLDSVHNAGLIQALGGSLQLHAQTFTSTAAKAGSFKAKDSIDLTQTSTEMSRDLYMDEVVAQEGTVTLNFKKRALHIQKHLYAKQGSHCDLMELTLSGNAHVYGKNMWRFSRLLNINGDARELIFHNLNLEALALLACAQSRDSQIIFTGPSHLTTKGEISCSLPWYSQDHLTLNCYALNLAKITAEKDLIINARALPRKDCEYLSNGLLKIDLNDQELNNHGHLQGQTLDITARKIQNFQTVIGIQNTTITTKEGFHNKADANAELGQLCLQQEEGTFLNEGTLVADYIEKLDGVQQIDNAAQGTLIVKDGGFAVKAFNNYGRADLGLGTYRLGRFVNHHNAIFSRGHTEYVSSFENYGTYYDSDTFYIKDGSFIRHLGKVIVNGQLICQFSQQANAGHIFKNSEIYTSAGIEVHHQQWIYDQALTFLSPVHFIVNTFKQKEKCVRLICA
jgi:adhesin HecA-like repeat protein